MARTAYKYEGRRGARYYWVSVLPVSPGDSRYDHVSCDVNVFWGRKRTIHGTCEYEAWNHEPHFYGNRRFFCNGDVGCPLEGSRMTPERVEQQRRESDRIVAARRRQKTPGSSSAQ